tara:strand:+ start:84 stop:620 length:537 start_codon:yes stop_codon:yes gene_type:complete
MKKILLIAFSFFIFQSTTGQEKNGVPFFSADFNLTFRVNENFEFGDDNDETFFVPSETLLRFGFGYEFKKKFAVSFNAGFDFHFDYSIGTIPTYLSFQYNIWNRGDDAFFVRFNTGRLWRLADRYSDGDYRGYGIGWRIESESKWKPVIKIMYHQKKIKNFEGGSLDNVSLGFGFSFY